MSDTERDLSGPRVPLAEKRKPDSGVIPMIRRIHPRHVIWALFVGLCAILGVQGKQYISRLEAIEAADRGQDDRFQVYQKTQNGHLHSIDLQLTEMKTEQRFMKEEQRNMRSVLERIERKIDQR